MLIAQEYKQNKVNEELIPVLLNSSKRDFTQAILLKPNFDTAYLKRGLVNFELGDTKSSNSDILKALSICPSILEFYPKDRIFELDGYCCDGGAKNNKLQELPKKNRGKSKKIQYEINI